jgi:hypothetical protein
VGINSSEQEKVPSLPMENGAIANRQGGKEVKEFPEVSSGGAGSKQQRRKCDE